MLPMRQEVLLNRVGHDLEVVLEFIEVHLVGWPFLDEGVVAMVPEQSTVRTDGLVVAGFADEFQRSLVFCAVLAGQFYVFFPFIVGMLLQSFDDVDDAHIFGDVLGHALADDGFDVALGADEDSSVDFHGQFESYALLAESVSALGHDPGRSVVEVVLLVAEVAKGSDRFGRNVVH